MGDKFTRPAQSADLVRAKLLKEALERGTPALSRAHEADPEVDPPDKRKPKPTKPISKILVECAPEAVSIVNQYEILRVNAEFIRMFGFAAEESVGRRIDELIVPADRAAETRWIGERLSQGQKVSIETRRRKKDGSLLDVFLAAAPLIIAGQKVASYVLYRDITEQKKAETLSSALYRIAERTSSAADLQHFYASIHAIVGELMYARNFYIALYDPSTPVTQFSLLCRRTRSHAHAEEARPRAHRVRSSHRQTRSSALRKSSKILSSKMKSNSSAPLPSIGWASPSKSAITPLACWCCRVTTQTVRFRDKDKEILMFVSQQVASAIEHKRHEEALTRSEARYRSLVQSAVYGIYRSTLEGKFLDVNPGADRHARIRQRRRQFLLSLPEPTSFSIPMR